jgi:hypothetical protein
MAELSDVITREDSRHEVKITFDVDRANASQDIRFNLGVPLNHVSSAALKGLLPFDGYEGVRDWYRNGILRQNESMAVVRESHIRENLDPSSTSAQKDAFEYLAIEGDERSNRGYQPPNEVVSIDGWVFPTGALTHARTNPTKVRKVTVNVVSDGQIVRELVYGIRSDGLMQYGHTFPEEPSMGSSFKSTVSSLFSR